MFAATSGVRGGDDPIQRVIDMKEKAKKEAMENEARRKTNKSFCRNETTLGVQSQHMSRTGDKLESTAGSTVCENRNSSKEGEYNLD